MIDKKKFYELIKQKSEGLFPGTLTQYQVDGFGAILDEWEKSGFSDIRWLSYLLATTYHETARTFKPLEEYGKGKGRTYGIPDATTKKVYYGRGFVQLTWKANYDKQSKKLGVDFVNYPEKVMEPTYAAKILIHGSADGDFTGRSLGTYFNANVDDPTNARRIINGTDKAALIAGYHTKFLKALGASVVSKQPEELPQHQPAPETSPVSPPVDPTGTPVGTGTKVSIGAAILAAIVAAVTAVLKANGLM